MADDIFEHPRLAAIYDALDPDRSDRQRCPGDRRSAGFSPMGKR
jgi:hypothetical protein